jgi:hypothetical protein
MDMQRKLISDSLIIVGVVMVVIGWRGLGAAGSNEFANYGLIFIGLILGIWGLVRYARGHDLPKE